MKLIFQRISLLLLLAAGSLTTGHAQTWTGRTNSLWNLQLITQTLIDPANEFFPNWSTYDPAIAGQTATFNNPGNGNTVLDLTAPTGASSNIFETIASLSFTSASVASYTIGSGAAGSQTLLLNSANTITAASGINANQLINANVELRYATAGSATITNSDADNTLTFAGAIRGGTGGTGGPGAKALTVSTVGTGDTISGIISNGNATSLSLTKTGSGVLNLTGVNTYSGLTSISAGTLAIGSTSFLPGWDTSGRYSVANGGAIAVGNAVSDDNIATMLATTNFVAGSSLGFDTSAGDRAYAVNLENTAQGALGIRKIGANKLTISGNNSYSGTTEVSNGTLAIGASERISNSGNLTVGGTGVFDLGASQNETVNAVTVSTTSGGITGTGTSTLTAAGGVTINNASGLNTISANLAGTSLAKSGAGWSRLTGTNTYTGNTTISGGVLSVASTGSLAGWNTAGRYSVAANAGLAVGNAVTDANIDTMLATGNFANNSILGFDTAAGNRTYTTNISGNLGIAKLGDNTLTLNTGRTWTRALVNGGTLALGASETLLTTGLIALDGTGTLDLGANHNQTVATVTVNSTAGGITGTGTSTLNATAADGFRISNASGTNTISAILVGSARLEKSGGGTSILSGANTYTGSTTVSDGKLAIGASERIANAGNLTVSGSGTFDLGDSQNETLNIVTISATAGGITGTGNSTITATNGFNITNTVGTVTLGANLAGTTLTKSGAGFVTLSGSAGYTGNTTISGGVLTILGAERIADTSNLVLNGGAIYNDGVRGGNFNLGNNQNETVGSIFLGGNGTAIRGTGTSTIIGASFLADIRRTGGADSVITANALSAGSFTKNGTGTFGLLGQSNAFAAGVAVNAGTLVVENIAGLTGGNISVASGAALSVSINSTATQIQDLIASGAFAPGSSIGLNGGADQPSDFIPVISGVTDAPGASIGLVKTGYGALRLGNNTYTGATKVSRGALVLDNATNLASTQFFVLNEGQNNRYFPYEGAALFVDGNSTISGKTVTLQSEIAPNTSYKSALFGRSNSVWDGDIRIESLTPGTVSEAYIGLEFYAGPTGHFTIGTSSNNTITFVNQSQLMLNGGEFGSGVGAQVIINSKIVGQGNITKGWLHDANFLSTESTFTGNVTLQGGTNRFAAIGDNGQASSLGAGGTNTFIEIQSNTQYLGGTTTSNRTFSSSSGTLNNVGNGTLSLTGNLSGTVLNFGGETVMAGNSTLATLGQTGTGNMTITGTHTGNTTVSNGSIILGASDRLANNRNITVTGNGTFNLGVFNETLNSVTVNATSGGIAGSGTLTASSFTISNDTGSNTIAANLAGAASLTKTGNGTSILAGTNTYSGATMVSRGTLIIQGDQSGATGLMTVASGAELWYSGNATMNGPVAISGTLANVGSIESLSVGSASFTSTGVFSSELGLSGLAAVNDQLNVTTAVGVSLESGADLRLTLGAGLTKANIGDMFFLIANQHTDASIAGVFTSLNGVATNLAEGSTFTWDGQDFRITYTADSGTASFSGGNDLAIQALTIPEPSTWVLLGLVAAAFLIIRRRKASAPHQG